MLAGCEYPPCRKVANPESGRVLPSATNRPLPELMEQVMSNDHGNTSWLMKLSDRLGWAFSLAFLCALVVTVALAVHHLYLGTMTTMRGVNTQLQSLATGPLASEPANMEALSADFVRKPLVSCVSKRTRVFATEAPFSSLIGVHGMGAIDEPELKAHADELLAECASEFVLTASSMMDARDRNQALEAFGIAPYSTDQVASLKLD